MIFDNNIVIHLQSFLEITELKSDIEKFSFKGNSIQNAETFSLIFLPKLREQSKNKIIFDDNFFNHTCKCEMDKWLEQLLNSKDFDYILYTSFCTVTPLLANCFKIEEGIINMKNFSQLLCNMDEDTITCMEYNGEVKTFETTEILFLDDITNDSSNTTIVILCFTLVGAVILSVIGTVVIVLIRGCLWLKSNGYCAQFRNFHYNRNVVSNEEEGTMVNEDSNKTESDKNEMPIQLTYELLHKLREQLENPETHEEAREMIEKLYDMFIIEEGYTNNNRDDEAHLYEELGNLQMPQQTTEDEADLASEPLQQNGAINFLKFIEEKMYPEKEIPLTMYSEPKDSTVHLYSELHQKLYGDNSFDDNDKKSTFKSSSSGSMTTRPLPAKPGPSTSRV